MKTIICIILFTTLFINAQSLDRSFTQINSDTTFSQAIYKDSLFFDFIIEFNVLNQNESLDSTFAESIYIVNVFTENDSSSSQTIIDTLTYPSTDRRDLCFFDMNFDKYLDLVFVTDVTMRGYKIYSVWLFDVNQNLFVKEPSYSDLCCNMWIDQEKSEIIIVYNDYRTYQNRVYKIIGNKPILYFMEEHELFKDNNKCFRKIKIFQLNNNELELKEESIEEAPDDVCDYL